MIFIQIITYLKLNCVKIAFFLDNSKKKHYFATELKKFGAIVGDNVEIDLETKGLTANTQYFVKLTPAGETAKEYVIKYKPAVTPANP